MVVLTLNGGKLYSSWWVLHLTDFRHFILFAENLLFIKPLWFNSTLGPPFKVWHIALICGLSLWVTGHPTKMLVTQTLIRRPQSTFQNLLYRAQFMMWFDLNCRFFVNNDFIDDYNYSYKKVVVFRLCVRRRLKIFGWRVMRNWTVSLWWVVSQHLTAINMSAALEFAYRLVRFALSFPPSWSQNYELIHEDVYNVGCIHGYGGHCEMCIRLLQRMKHRTANFISILFRWMLKILRTTFQPHEDSA